MDEVNKENMQDNNKTLVGEGQARRAKAPPRECNYLGSLKLKVEVKLQRVSSQTRRRNDTETSRRKEGRNRRAKGKL